MSTVRSRLLRVCLAVPGFLVGSAFGIETKWRRVDPSPPPRTGHAMAYDSARGVTVLFGGWDGSYDGETWEWDGTSWSLRVDSGPVPREDHAMAYDSARGVTVLFGGWNGSYLGDTWSGMGWPGRCARWTGLLRAKTTPWRTTALAA
ncbi:MAG: hypothetical protein HS102_02390 [Planctomycetia bacterium]|nr:hypothetical protein [Planctomycetia bacterium]